MTVEKRARTINSEKSFIIASEARAELLRKKSLIALFACTNKDLLAGAMYVVCQTDPPNKVHRYSSSASARCDIDCLFAHINSHRSSRLFLHRARFICSIKPLTWCVSLHHFALFSLSARESYKKQNVEEEASTPLWLRRDLLSMHGGNFSHFNFHIIP